MHTDDHLYKDANSYPPPMATFFARLPRDEAHFPTLPAKPGPPSLWQRLCRLFEKRRAD